MVGVDGSGPDDRQERRATRRRFLRVLGAAAGAHFVLLNDWVFAAETPKRPRKVEESLVCGRRGNWPKESAVYEDSDCGKRDEKGVLFLDQDCGLQSPHLLPGNGTWDDGDCGKVDTRGHRQTDECCGLSAAGWGGSHWDNDCGKKPYVGFEGVFEDEDCNKPTKALGRYKDGDCGKKVPGGGEYSDSFCRWWL